SEPVSLLAGAKGQSRLPTVFHRNTFCRSCRVVRSGLCSRDGALTARRRGSNTGRRVPLRGCAGYALRKSGGNNRRDDRVPRIPLPAARLGGTEVWKVAGSG